MLLLSMKSNQITDEFHDFDFLKHNLKSTIPI